MKSDQQKYGGQSGELTGHDFPPPSERLASLRRQSLANSGLGAARNSAVDSRQTDSVVSRHQPGGAA